MITDIELLSYIRETAQMGHDGIDTVLNYSPCTPLTDALRQQKAEYGELCSSATELLKARGSDPEPLPMGAKMGLMMSRARNAMSPPSSSKIAEMMITGNTKGAIMSEEKPNQREKIVLRGDKVRSLIPKNIPVSQTEDYVVKALEHYSRFLRQRAERDSR